MTTCNAMYELLPSSHGGAAPGPPRQCCRPRAAEQAHQLCRAVSALRHRFEVDGLADPRTSTHSGF